MNTIESAYIHTCACYPDFTVLPWELALFPGVEEVGEKEHWYTLFVHACNYSKGHVVECVLIWQSTLHLNCINRHKKHLVCY